MASITKSISARTDARGYSEIFFRISLGREHKIRYRTHIFIPAKRWDASQGRIASAKTIGAEYRELTDKDAKVRLLELKILKICEACPSGVLDKELLSFILEKIEGVNISELTDDYIYNIVQGRVFNDSFFDIYDKFVEGRVISKGRRNHYNVLRALLKRYEEFVRGTERGRSSFHLDVNAMRLDDIEDLEAFLRNEHQLYERYPSVFARMTIHRVPMQRGTNTVWTYMEALRAFFNWCVRNEIAHYNPFLLYKGAHQKYGTPYYLTLEERDHIADFDLSGCGRMVNVVRDMFILQCCIGCRVSDLLRLREADIIEGEVNYIPRKTQGVSGATVKVPLNRRARAIVDKYRGIDKGGRLMPFPRALTYNEVLKRVFTLCGVTRLVTTLNPITGEEEKKPLNEIATSHIARRTFIGNLYKKVKDPNLICPLSGHVTGSKAFARYREIDREIRVETVKLID